MFSMILLVMMEVNKSIELFITIFKVDMKLMFETLVMMENSFLKKQTNKRIFLTFFFFVCIVVCDIENFSVGREKEKYVVT